MATTNAVCPLLSLTWRCPAQPLEKVMHSCNKIWRQAFSSDRMSPLLRDRLLPLLLLQVAADLRRCQRMGRQDM